MRLSLRLAEKDARLLRERAERQQLRPGAEARRLIVAALRATTRRRRPAA